MALMDVKVTNQPQHRAAPDAIIKVDLDDRAYVFPGSKLVTQLHVLAYRPHKIRFEAHYAFNESKASPELFELSFDDARELSRRMIEAVYRAQSTQIISREVSLVLSVVTNGYILQFGTLEAPKEIMLSTGCIWRVCGAIARAVDFIAPISTN